MQPFERALRTELALHCAVSSTRVREWAAAEAATQTKEAALALMLYTKRLAFPAAALIIDKIVVQVGERFTARKSVMKDAERLHNELCAMEKKADPSQPFELKLMPLC